MTLIKVARNARRIFLGRSVSLITSFIGAVLVTRVLPVEQYGVLSISGQIIGISLLIVSLGIAVTPGTGVVTSLTYFLSKAVKEKNKQKQKGVINTCFKIELAASSIAAVILFIFAEQIAALFNFSQYSFFIRILSLGIILNSINQLFPSIFQAHQKMQYQMWQDTLSSLLYFLVIAFIIFFGFNSAPYGYILSYSLVMIPFLFITLKKFYPKVKANGVKTKKLLSYSFASYSSSILWYLCMTTPPLILSSFFNTAEVAYFTTASVLYSVVGLPLFAISTSIFPAIVGMEREKSNKLFQKVTRYSIMIGFFAALLFILFPAGIMTFVYTSKYIKSASLLPIYAVAVVINYSFYNVSAVAGGVGKVSAVLKANSIASLSIPISFLLIPNYGIYGAAVSVVTAVALSSMYYMFWSRRLRYTYPYKSALKSLAAFLAAVSLFFAFQVQPTDVFSKSIFVAVFLAALFIFKEITKKDIKLAKSLITELFKFK